MSAFKIQYNQGIETPILKAKDETENEMQTVTLKKKQFIAQLVRNRIDRTTREYEFIDQNDNIIVSFRCHWP